MSAGELLGAVNLLIDMTEIGQADVLRAQAVRYRRLGSADLRVGRLDRALGQQVRRSLRRGRDRDLSAIAVLPDVADLDEARAADLAGGQP